MAVAMMMLLLVLKVRVRRHAAFLTIPLRRTDVPRWTATGAAWIVSAELTNAEGVLNAGRSRTIWRRCALT
jgi:hypothetical protein